MLRQLVHRGRLAPCSRGLLKRYFNDGHVSIASYVLHDMAHLAESSVVATQGGTVVHATVCSSPSASDDDFLPLTVDYRDRYYASGHLPSTSNRRERHGSESEILIARVIDRSIRPLFAKGYTNEVQITITAHAIDGIHDPVVLAVNAASYALMHSQQPWNGPIACTRIGFIGGKLVVDPPAKDMSQSDLNLLYAGTSQRTLMIEVSANEIPENTVFEGFTLAQHHIAHQLQQLTYDSPSLSTVSTTGQQTWQRGDMSIDCFNVPSTVYDDIYSKFRQDIEAVFRSGLQRKERSAAEGDLQTTIRRYISSTYTALPPIVGNMATAKLMSDAFRAVVASGERVDGRKHTQLRSIVPRNNVLPTVHGSSTFYRGDTRVLCTATLGAIDDARESRNPSTGQNDIKEYFYLHYDFPPYCTGELGSAMQTNRRMIGHGNLAEKALKAVIPATTEFPHVVRVFSECTASNGSSSMASVCGASLALLDAGVPIKNMVAGVSIGLVTNGDSDDYCLLTDILGTEDYYGDMDFKVAGTHSGVTAIQLDAKLASGIPLQALRLALSAAKIARVSILHNMEMVLCHPVTNKTHVPHGAVVRMHPDKKRHLIGPGGEMRRFIETTFDCQVTIMEDENLVYVFGPSRTLVREAELLVQDLVVEIQEGDTYRCEVVELRDFGAVVRLTRAQTALLHVSELSHAAELLRKPVSELLAVGQRLDVKVLHVDNIAGNTRVSRKALLNKDSPDHLVPTPPAPEERTIGVAPEFPITPPRQFNLSYFATKVASELDVKRAMERQTASPGSGPTEVDPPSKPVSNLVKSLEDALEGTVDDDILVEKSQNRLSHALDKFKRGGSKNDNSNHQHSRNRVSRRLSNKSSATPKDKSN